MARNSPIERLKIKINSFKRQVFTKDANRNPTLFEEARKKYSEAVAIVAGKEVADEEILELVFELDDILIQVKKNV